MTRTNRNVYSPPFVAFMLVLLLWCSGAHAEEIIVSAAASLGNAMQAVGDQFQTDHSDTRVIFNFASSGALLQQIAHGAPVDVFASANQAFMDRAAKQKLIRARTRCNFARNTLVLAVPAGSAIGIQDLGDLVSAPQLRISIGDPATVPAGRYARQALQRIDLWGKLRDRLILATSVRQVLDYLRRDEIDAGLVYNTDVRIAGEAVRSIKIVATDDPIVYCIAVTAVSSRPAGGQQFIDYLLSDTGSAVLATFGFERP